MAITAAARTWTRVSVSLDELGNPSTIKRINFINNSSSELSIFTLDDIRLIPDASTNQPGNAWKLVSFNRQPDDISVESVIEPISSSIKSVWAYDNGK